MSGPILTLHQHAIMVRTETNFTFYLRTTSIPYFPLPFVYLFPSTLLLYINLFFICLPSLFATLPYIYDMCHSFSNVLSVSASAHPNWHTHRPRFILTSDLLRYLQRQYCKFATELLAPPTDQMFLSHWQPSLLYTHNIWALQHTIVWKQSHQTADMSGSVATFICYLTYTVKCTLFKFSMKRVRAAVYSSGFWHLYSGIYAPTLWRNLLPPSPA